MPRGVSLRRPSPLLPPEHLLAARAMFNRTKDWLDIEQMTKDALSARVRSETWGN